MLTQKRALSATLGALLLACTNSANASQLALELFQEGNFNACRIECARSIDRNPSPKLELLHATCGIRLGMDTRAALRKLCNNTNTPPQIAAMANYELGRAEWIAGNNPPAFSHIHKAFITTTSADLYRRAGCSLSFIIKEYPELDDAYPGLNMVLATCSKQWNRTLRAECRKPKSPHKPILTAPARWIISFYQHQISPAIGSRCSLHPSCSRYAQQALKTHGILGIGAIGDRFIREPSVVAARKKPIVINGHSKYADPLSDHDGWLKP